ncbi:MAG: hypothetical protein WKF40_00660 [Thermoleophilaceae bacterium]
MSASSRFDPSGPLHGEYLAPADKSISHRAALFGAMADQPVTIRNYLRSADTMSTLDALLSLGAGVDESGDDLTIRGVGLRAALEATGGRIDVGNAGTLLRLLPGWLAGQTGGDWSLDGDESIRRRPVDRVVEPLRRMGGAVSARDGRFTPLVVRGGELTGIDYELPVPSAQVKSCVLIAGMLASGSTSITEASMSRDHTERLMRRARVPFRREGLKATISQVDELELEEITVPGDPSSAAFMVAAACLVPDSRLLVGGLGLNWTRTGFFRIAQRMGAVIVGDLEPPGHLRRRRARRGPGRGPRPAGGHRGGARGGAAGHRRADARGLAGRLRRGRHRGPGGRGAAPQGVGSDRRRGGSAGSAGRRHRGRGGRLRGARHRRAAARGRDGLPRRPSPGHAGRGVRSGLAGRGGGEGHGGRRGVLSRVRAGSGRVGGVTCLAALMG